MQCQQIACLPARGNVLFSLPIELLELVYSYLSLTDLRNAACVCSAMHRIRWPRIDLRRLKAGVYDNANWPSAILTGIRTRSPSEIVLPDDFHLPPLVLSADKSWSSAGVGTVR